MVSIAEAVAANVAAAQARAQKTQQRGKKRNFYASAAWRRLRYAVLRDNKQKHGETTCEACGSSKGPWHVDHIVPVSKDWNKRLDRTNLQVMCADCNMGKSNTDAIDWR